MPPDIKINGLKLFLLDAYKRYIYDDISASMVVSIVSPVKCHSVNIMPMATGTDD